MKRAPLIAGLAGGMALLLAGCGIGSQRSADPLPATQVPFGLLAPAPTNAGPQGVPAVEAAILYLVKAGHLVAVARELPAPATVNARLNALSAGPTADEAAGGLSSAVSAPGSAPTGTIQYDHATITLTASFEQLATRVQVEALAQLVYTATAIPGVDTVSFRIDGRAVAVPRGNNTTTSQPVTRSDYRSFAPLVSS